MKRKCNNQKTNAKNRQCLIGRKTENFVMFYIQKGQKIALQFILSENNVICRKFEFHYLHCFATMAKDGVK